MKQVREIGLENFLKKKEKWVRERKKCAEERGVKYCDECKDWPCELLKREVLMPMEIKKFKEFMRKIKL